MIGAESMSKDSEADKAAREWDLIARHIAYKLCGNNLDKIGERFDRALAAALKGVEAGVEWERRRALLDRTLQRLYRISESHGKESEGE